MSQKNKNVEPQDVMEVELPDVYNADPEMERLKEEFLSTLADFDKRLYGIQVMNAKRTKVLWQWIVEQLAEAEKRGFSNGVKQVVKTVQNKKEYYKRKVKNDDGWDEYGSMWKRIAASVLKDLYYCLRSKEWEETNDE